MRESKGRGNKTKQTQIKIRTTGLQGRQEGRERCEEQNKGRKGPALEKSGSSARGARGRGWQWVVGAGGGCLYQGGDYQTARSQVFPQGIGGDGDDWLVHCSLLAPSAWDGVWLPGGAWGPRAAERAQGTRQLGVQWCGKGGGRAEAPRHASRTGNRQAPSRTLAVRSLGLWRRGGALGGQLPQGRLLKDGLWEAERTLIPTGLFQVTPTLLPQAGAVCLQAYFALAPKISLSAHFLRWFLSSSGGKFWGVSSA